MKRIASTIAIILAAITSGGVSAAPAPPGPNHLIELPTRRAHIYDNERGVLYISTTAGSVERYELSSRTFLEPLIVPGDPGTLELSLDNSRLFVTDWSYNGSSLRVNEIDLATLEVNVLETSPVDPLPPLGPLESRFFDLAIGTHGVGIISSDFLGSSSLHTPLRSFDSLTKSLMIRTDVPFYPGHSFAAVSNRAYIFRNASRDTILILESNVSPGRARTFDAVNNRFIAANVVSNGANVAGAVSNDGSLVAVQIRHEPLISILTSTLEPVTQLTGYSGGFEFDPNRNVLYAVDSIADQLVALSTDSWQELFRHSLDEDVEFASPISPDVFFRRAGDGVTSFSDNGRYLFLSTPSGIRVIEIVPEPSICILVLIAVALMDFRHCISRCKV